MDDKFRSLVFTSLSHYSVDGNVLLFPVLMTVAYYGSLGLSSFIIGLMPVVYNLISGFLGVYVGSYADRVDNDAAILTFGLILNGLAALVFSLPFITREGAYEFLIIGSILLGVGQSIYHPIGATILSHTYGPKESASYMGINGSFGSLGRSSFVPVVLFFSVFTGRVLGLQVVFIYFIVAAALVYFGLKFFKRKNYRYEQPLMQSKPVEANRRGGVLPVVLIVLVIIVFLRSMFISVATTWMPTYLESLFNSEQVMATITLIAFMAPVFGQPYFGYVTSRFGGKFSISVTSIGFLIFFVLFLFFGKGLVLVLVSYTIFAFFAYTGFPVLMGYVAQVAPKEHLTRANAWVWGIGNTIGGSVGLLLFDGAREFIGIFDSFVVMLVFALVSVVLLVYLPGKNPAVKQFN